MQISYEPDRDPQIDWSDEVTAQLSAHPEDDEDTEAFLSPEWD
jgi:hypothetical protein